MRRGRTEVGKELPFLGGVTALPVLLVAAAAVLLFATGGGYERTLIGLGASYLVAAIGYNVVLGYSGVMAFGQAGFVAVGAYTYAVLQQWGFAIFPAALLAVILTAGVTAFIGLAVLKTRGFYLALVTLAFAEAIIVLVRTNGAITGGDDGMFVDLGGEWAPLIAIVCATIVVLLAGRLVRSRTGRATIMVGADEESSLALGVRPVAVKLQAFTIGGTLAGLGGVLMAGSLQFITPQSFGLELTLLLLAMIVVGGLGSIWGTVIGVVFMTYLSLEIDVAGLRDVVYGGVLLLVVLVLPGGLIRVPGTVSRWIRRLRRGGGQT